MFKKLFRILNDNQKKFFLIILFLTLINAFFEVISIASILPVINLIIKDNFINDFPYISNFLLNVSNYLLPQSILENNNIRNNFIVAGVFFFLVIFLIKVIFYIFLQFVLHDYTNKLVYSISMRLYKGYLNLDYIFHTQRNSANLKQNILIETNTFSAVFSFFLTLIVEGIIVLFIGIFLFLYNWKLSLIISLFLIFASYIILKLTKSKLISWGKQRVSSMEKRFKSLQEGLESIKEIYIFQKASNFLNNFSKHSDTYFKVARNHQVVLQSTRPSFEFLGLLSLIVLLLILMFQGNSIPYIISTIGLFLAASFRLLSSLNKIIFSTQSLKYNNACTDRILSELNLINENYKIVKKNIKINFKKNIIFKDVSFIYPNKNEPVLDNINFSIEKGSKVGIEGVSGSGKSTLINLILTLTIPSKGNIKVDGINLEKNNLSWTKNIGYVAQNTYLTDNTIEQNIAFGLPVEQIDSKKLNQAINSSQLSKFVSNLKEGVKSRIGEKGMLISGGQLQRIGIARALYNDPNVIILDEPTSSLDSENETLIIDTIYNLGKEKTIIIVSHRKYLINRCDKILSLTNHKVIEKNSSRLNGN